MPSACRAVVRRPALTFALLLGIAPSIAVGELVVSPARVVLDRPEARAQLLVFHHTSDGPPNGARRRDVTREASYAFSSPGVAAVERPGHLRPAQDGHTELVVRHGDQEVRVAVEVTGQLAPPPVSFAAEIVPILTKARCNAGGCHGKAEGQNGFKLSVFGFDPAADLAAIARDGRGRRIDLAAPDQSLLLRKATARTPHGGGLKIEPASTRYQLVRRWIAEGACDTPSKTTPASTPARDEPIVVAIEVEPAEQLLGPRETQQLRVTARYSDGSSRCVTADAEFDSNAPTIAVADQVGLVQSTEIPGEAAILARYLGNVAICRITMPRTDSPVERPAENNFIDRLVFDKLGRLGIPPSDLADDATFLRRVYLDAIGTLPTSAEAREFLNDSDPAKRSRVIGELLRRPEYVDYWTMRWSDILRVDQTAISPAGAVAMTRWLRGQLARNRPYDEFVREILVAHGPTLAESPAAFYKALDTPEKASRAVSQLFLGVRIECAQCHHHPSERWGQDDYYAWAGFFTGVSRKPLSTGGEAVLSRGGSELNHPRTGRPVPVRPLGGAPVVFSPNSDRRVALADWITAPDNPYFARMIVNRLWAHYFGRGLVEPIDDLRATNPATNEPLLDALCGHLREVGFDLRAFTRTLLESRTYQLSSLARNDNVDDRQSFSHALDKALPAEVLMDMVSQSAGVPEKFNGWPVGYRSIQLWDSRVPTYFFRIFGRPARTSVCECERSNEPSIAQALHLLNSPEITQKLEHRRGFARELAATQLEPAAVIDELYLRTLTRLPRDDERTASLAVFSTATSRREAVEDILWSLLNRKEFLYNH